MVRARTVGIGIGIAGLGVLGAVLMSKLAPVAAGGAGAVSKGKFGVIDAGSYTTADDYGAHRFQFRVGNNDERLGNEDVDIVVEGVYSKSKTTPELKWMENGVEKTAFTNTYHTPAADQINQVTVISHIVEAVNIYITRVKTGEKFWYQCIIGCNKISGG
jgi:hypothetical protein